MKPIMTYITLLAMALASPAQAEEACNNAIAVQVNGLVCDFCARALEKVFSKQEGVADIEVDLDNGLVTVIKKPGQTIDDETLTKLITDSGYDVAQIDRDC